MQILTTVSGLLILDVFWASYTQMTSSSSARWKVNRSNWKSN